MSDLGELYEDWHQHKREQKEEKADNTRLLLSVSGLSYLDRGTVILFREKNKPPVDYYPTTGKWKTTNNKVLWGGYISFLRWYSKQKNV